MKRALALLAALVVAAGIFLLIRREDSPEAAYAPIERLLRVGRIADAKTELEATRRHADSATVDYLDGLIHVAEGNDLEALPPLLRARSTRPDDWRIANTLAAAEARCGRFADALRIVQDYVARREGDERGQALLAQFLLDKRFGPPDGTKALAALDRIPPPDRRVAAAADATAVRDADVARLRIRATLTLGRFVDAMIAAKKEADASPSDPEAWFLLGEAARQTDPPHGDEALDAYRRAARLAPADGRYVGQFTMAVLDPKLVVPGTQKPFVAEALADIESLLSKSPDDPGLLLLKARLLARGDDASLDAASALYYELEKRDLPKELRLAVLRNHGVLLYDFKQGGRPGDYLRDSYELLKRYVDAGGVVDDSLRSTWDELRAKYEK